ncbi:hypothetical protein K438DRAFT_1769978 [Mycena galopus ATCC 62051]|nr:hypothetical protein K438DRAFT_1769978 [Mycena galopus ATCC 62051]
MDGQRSQGHAKKISPQENKNPISLQAHLQKTEAKMNTMETTFKQLTTEIQRLSVPFLHLPRGSLPEPSSSPRLSLMPETSDDPFQSIYLPPAASSISGVNHGMSSTSASSGSTSSASSMSLVSPITASTGSQTPSGPSADLNSASNVSADLPDPFRTLDITLASASLGPSTTEIEPAIGLLLDPHPAPLPMLTLQFRHSEVPEPPILCFKGDGRSNLNELVILWTDEAGAPWHTCPKASVLRSCLPKIEGHPIAIKHWAHVYRHLEGKGKNIWKTIKTRWSEWQFIFEHWEKTPDDAVFWNGFSPNPDGQVQSLAQVSNSLRVMRTRQDAEDAASARTEYGDLDFKTNFIRHGSAGVVLTVTDGVARRYRKLLAAEAQQNFDALAFKQQFSYIGRRGPSVMTNTNDIASRYIQIRGDNSALRYDLN